MDVLIWIAIFTFIGMMFTMFTAIIQCIEMWILVKNQRETNRILSNPGQLLLTGVTQMAKELETNEEAQRLFFNLVAASGQIAYSAAVEGAKDKIKSVISKEIPVPKKYRWIYEIGQNFLGGKKDGASPAPSSPSGLAPL